MTNDDRVCIACGASPNDTGPGIEPADLLATRPLCRDALRCHSRELRQLLYGWRDKIAPHSTIRERLAAARLDGAPRSRVAMAITVETSDRIPKDELHIVSGGVTTVVKL